MFTWLVTLDFNVYTRIMS